MEIISDRNCRICLSQCEIRDLDIAQFASKYLSCTGFEINKTDVARKICSTCKSELINTSNFLAKCAKTEVILENLRGDLMEKEIETLEMSLDEFDEVMSEVKDELENVNDVDTIVELSNDDAEEYEQVLQLNCDFCDYEVLSCKRIFDLKTHVKKCHSDLVTELKCSKCTMTFLLQSLLNFHIKECHSENSIKDHFTCTFCSYHSLRTETIQRHVTTHHKDVQLFSCIICQKNFRTMDHMRLHIKQTICGTNIFADGEIDIEYEIKCDFCGFSCALEANMKYHVEKMHQNEQLSRCACGSDTVYCKDLAVEHLKYKCNLDRSCKAKSNTIKMGVPKRKPKFTKDIDGLTPEERKKIRTQETVECEFCHEKITRGSLNRHITNLHRGIKYFCQYCNKSYTLAYNLKLHIAKHHMNRQTEYPCQYCNRTFNAWASRYYHQIRIHTKNFKYSCEACDKHFIHQADYDDHNSIHTGAKIRECNECRETFPTRDSLRSHKETVHRKDPPLKCNVCGKAFTREKQLRKHLKQIHEQITVDKIPNSSNGLVDELDEYEEAERILVEYIEDEEMGRC